MKLKSFTLIELIITLLLSSIVLMIALFGFKLINVYTQSIKRNSEIITKVTLLRNKLNEDFFRAQQIQFDNNELIVFKDKDIAKYQFSDSLIVLKQAQLIDTLNITTCNIKASTIKDKELINFFEFTVLNKKDSLYLCFNKKYDNNILINLK